VSVVLDTNVLLSAFAARGLCEAVYQLCLAQHQIVRREERNPTKLTEHGNLVISSDCSEAGSRTQRSALAIGPGRRRRRGFPRYHPMPEVRAQVPRGVTLRSVPWLPVLGLCRSPNLARSTPSWNQRGCHSKHQEGHRQAECSDGPPSVGEGPQAKSKHVRAFDVQSHRLRPSPGLHNERAVGQAKAPNLVVPKARAVPDPTVWGHRKAVQHGEPQRPCPRHCEQADQKEPCPRLSWRCSCSCLVFAHGLSPRGGSCYPPVWPFTSPMQGIRWSNPMSAHVAVYVQGRYAKPAYKVESHDVRPWPGLELVVDTLRRAGVEADYYPAATVGRWGRRNASRHVWRIKTRLANVWQAVSETRPTRFCLAGAFGVELTERSPSASARVRISSWGQAVLAHGRGLVLEQAPSRTRPTSERREGRVVLRPGSPGLRRRRPRGDACRRTCAPSTRAMRRAEAPACT